MHLVHPDSDVSNRNWAPSHFNSTSELGFCECCRTVVFRFGAAPAWLTVISWRPMFQVYSEGPFHGNGQRFATMEEADASAQARYARWTMARDFRIDPSDEPVNYIRQDGKDASITPLGASGQIES